MRSRASVLVAFIVAAMGLAGCIGGDGPSGEAAKKASAHEDHQMVSPEAHRLTVWGLVTDDAFQPIPGASVKAVTGDNTTTNETGGFELTFAIDMGASLILTATADGHQAASARVESHNESRLRVDFRLAPEPSDEPFHDTLDFGGNLACGVLVGAGHSHDPEGPPTTVEEDCGANDPNNRRVFTIPLSAGPQGLLLELAWEATTELARQMEMGLTIGDVTSGWASGPNVLRVALGAESLEPIEEGGEVTVVVQVASFSEGEESEAALGFAFQQPFTLYATTFYGGAMDDDFTAVPA